MGIYESFQRSQGNIDSIAGALKGYFDKQRETENRKRLQALLTKQEATPSPDLAASMNTVDKAETIPVEDRTATAAPATGALQSRSLLPQVSRSAAPRGIADMDVNDIMGLSELLSQSPGLQPAAKLATEAAAARQPRFDIMKGSDNAYDIFQLEQGKKPSVIESRGPTFPPRATAATPRWRDRVDKNGNFVTKTVGDKKFVVQEEVTPSGTLTGNTRTGKDVSRPAAAGGGAGDKEKDLAELRKERDGLFDDARKIELDLSAARSGLINGAQIDPKNPEHVILQNATITQLNKDLQEKYNKVGLLDDKLKAAGEMTGTRIKIMLTKDAGGHKAGTKGTIDRAEFNPQIMRVVE